MRMGRYYDDKSYGDAIGILIGRILRYFDLIALALLVLKLCGVVMIGYGVIALLYIVPPVIEFFMDVIRIRIEKIRKKKEEERYAMEFRTEYGVSEDE